VAGGRRADDGASAAWQAQCIATGFGLGLQSCKYTSENFQKILADDGVACSMTRSGDVRDNAAMESFLSLLKTERTARTDYCTRRQASADVSDCIERLYKERLSRPPIQSS
jgi:putative transposase